MPEVSVIIVNYNSGDRLRRCLDCLAAQSFTDFETIVIDNGSQDASIDAARASAPPARVIDAGKNLGFAAANNRAAKEARGEWLAFLNPDAYAALDWLEQLMSATRRYAWADAFGSTQLDAADPDRIDGAGDVYHVFGLSYRGGFGRPAEELPPDGECFAPCAAAALYRKSRFDALGGFDERFFCYGEDADLGFRLRLAGGRAVQVRAAVVRHEGSGISGRKSAFTVYHGHRNRIWTAYKNTPGFFYWPLLPFQLLLDFVLFIRHASAGQGGAYLRAMRDAGLGLASYARIRRDIQRTRAVSLAALAAAMTWSPMKLIRRSPSLRPPAKTAPP